MSKNPIKRAFSRVRGRLWAFLVAGALSLMCVLPWAHADWNRTVGRGIEVTGVNQYGPLRLGPHYVETTRIGTTVVEAYPVWCIQALYADPGPNEMIDIATLTDSRKLGPDHLDLETAQVAWLLNKYQNNTGDDVNLAALAYLIHLNFEQDYRQPERAQQTVNTLVQAVLTQHPEIEDRARAYVNEARSSAAIGYDSGTVAGDGQRSGTLQNVGVHPQDTTAWVEGIPLRITLSGPAVFDDTGTNTWSGASASGPLHLTWSATGNGKVSATMTASIPVRRTLTKFGANGLVQDMLSYGNRPEGDPLELEVPGPSWNVIYDFQPIGTSRARVVEVNRDGQIVDELVTAVDSSYGDGTWTRVDGQPVNVTYRATAYRSDSRPQQQDTVPADARPAGSVTVTANGPDQTLSASLDITERGFYTWVWEVRKSDQGQNAVYVHADWADAYGLPAETTLENFPFRPVGTSNVQDSKVIEAGHKLSDTFVTEADPNYRDGQWTRIPNEDGVRTGEYVPVVYRADLYKTAEVLPVTGDTVPIDSVLIDSQTVTATGPGETLVVESDEPVDAGFYTWVWAVRGEDQSEPNARWIESGWADSYGLEDETASARSRARIDSSIKIHETASGIYLTDDLWVSGLPANHGEFTGGFGFAPDTTEITQELLFFPRSVPVTEEHRGQAQKIGETVTLPAVNGYHGSVGDVSWLIARDDDGLPEAGTYVFVTSFAGDDRVAPLVTSVEDVTEQFVLSHEPTLHTTLTHEGSHEAPAEGIIDLVDRVCYTNVQPGKEYTVDGVLMDRATGEPIVDSAGEDIRSSTTITPDTSAGCVEVTFRVDAALLAGKTTVAFESLRSEGREIAVHADLEDENQTVVFRKPPPPPTVPPSEPPTVPPSEPPVTTPPPDTPSVPPTTPETTPPRPKLPPKLVRTGADDLLLIGSCVLLVGSGIAFVWLRRNSRE